jgi:hypothetical protein
MKKLIWVFVALILTILLAVSWAPFALRAYVQSQYSGIKIRGDVRIHWDCVEFTNVLVNRPNVVGQLDSVFVDHARRVRIKGGELDVTLVGGHGPGSVSASSQGLDVVADALRVSIHKGAVDALVDNLHIDSKEVCFKTGTVAFAGLEANVANGCVTRDAKIATADRAVFDFDLPFPIPQMDHFQVAEFSGLRANMDDEILAFEHASVRPSNDHKPVFEINGHSTLKVTPDDALLDVTDLKVDHPWVSPDVVTFHSLGLIVPRKLLSVRGPLVKLTEGTLLQLTVGPATIRADPTTNHVEGDEECNTWIKAMPDPMPQALIDALGHFSGRLSFEVSTKPVPSLSIKNKCRFECSASLIKDLRSGRFEYMAYDKSNNLFPRRLGALSPDWVPLNTLPPSVPKAFITLEDPGFNAHQGVITQALENSLKADLQLGRFFRGGSTITMQLAKNLWLKRSKTISRKAQEVLLTTVLESCLSKADILELYLNAVEFAPNLYGLGPAAKHYFDKSPSSLEPDQAFYLASLLPHPRTAEPPTPGVMARTRKLMAVLAERGYISDELVPVDAQVDSTGWESE